jgi:hypothetical protein
VTLLKTSWWPADTTTPVLETTVGSVLREAVQRALDHPALVEGVADAARRRWTYGGLLGDAERVARALLARLEPGERVAIWAANSPEWVLVEYGAALAGVVLVTVNPALTGRARSTATETNGLPKATGSAKFAPPAPSTTTRHCNRNDHPMGRCRGAGRNKTHFEPKGSPHDPTGSSHRSRNWHRPICRRAAGRPGTARRPRWPHVSHPRRRC